MPRVTLTYDLPEDDEDFRYALDGHLYALVLWDFDQHLRSQIKYHDRDELQPLRDELYRLADERGIEI